MRRFKRYCKRCWYLQAYNGDLRWHEQAAAGIYQAYLNLSAH